LHDYISEKEKRTKTVSRKRNQKKIWTIEDMRKRTTKGNKKRQKGEEMDSHSQAVGGRWILTRQGKARLDGGAHFRL
jgi:hypothetical protein